MRAHAHIPSFNVVDWLDRLYASEPTSADRGTFEWVAKIWGVEPCCFEAWAADKEWRNWPAVVS